MLSWSTYWRLSSFYFFYFALLGTWLPFWSLYLAHEGYSALDIGYLAAIIYITKIFAPSIWGFIADKSGRYLTIVQLGCALAFFTFLFIFSVNGFWAMAAVIAAYSFFWNAVLAQFEVITIGQLNGRYHTYSRIRLWGSIGFIVAVVGLGVLFDSISIKALPIALALILLCIFLSSLVVKPAKTLVDHAVTTGLWSVIKRPAVVAFLAAGVLLQISHAPYYTFFSIYMESLGYSTTQTGVFWGVGVTAEVLLFIWMYKLLARFSLRQIMLVSLLLSAIRWLMIAYVADNEALLFIAQVLHAASFGSFHAVAVEYVRRHFAQGHQGQGMAIYSGLSFGGGSAIGAIISGAVWQYGAVFSFVGAGFLCILAYLIVWFLVKGREAQALSV